MSSRYVHPSGDAVLDAMARLGGHKIGHSEKAAQNESAKSKPANAPEVRINIVFSGAGRGNRTPTVLSDLRILSPLRLPISPSRQLQHVLSSELLPVLHSRRASAS